MNIKYLKNYGQPTLESLVRIFRQLERNAQKAHLTLGGGQLGYPFLILAQTLYNSIPSSTPVVRLVDPGSFTPTPHPIPAGALLREAIPLVAPLLTAEDIATQKIRYNERRCLYNECQSVEHPLRK